MIILSKEQVILLHAQLIAETGGAEGVRDEGLLESALYAPFQSFGDRDVYPSIQQKAARLGIGLTKNHAFVDGNKRIGAHAMLVFLSKLISKLLATTPTCPFVVNFIQTISDGLLRLNLFFIISYL